MRMRLMAVVAACALAGCGPAEPPLRVVVRVYRPDGVLHREYRGSSRDGRHMPVIEDGRGGAQWVNLRERTVEAAVGWQIEVDAEPETFQ